MGGPPAAVPSLPGAGDSHCHLGWPDLARDLEGVLRRAREAGLVFLVDVGIDLESSRRALERARVFEGLHPTAGLHPNDCLHWEAEFPGLEALCEEEEFCAVGETGLDLYRERIPLEVQRTSLEAHLRLAADRGRPVILHCRDAFRPLFETLEGFAPIRGVLHCFTGGPEEAEACLELGLHVSFAGPLGYPRNEALREAAALVPEDRLLAETDAPFLPPQPWRGRRNEPAYVTETIRVLAGVRKRPPEPLAALLRANAARLFGFPEPSPGEAFGRKR